jgi:hypothetical protein
MDLVNRARVVVPLLLTVVLLAESFAQVGFTGLESPRSR